MAEDWTITRVNGVLENCLPTLQTAAESILGSYNKKLYHADMALAQVRPDINLGDFLGTYGGLPLNNPILTIRHSLDVGPVGTDIVTAQPWR